MKSSLFVLFALLLTAGCATKPPPPPKREEVFLEEIPYGSTENVRTGEVVKAYPIARWVDPANKNMMHERSVIYRLERSSRWRLKPPAGQEDATLLGPVAGVRKPYYAPAPTSAELARELQKQRAASATLDARVSQVNQITQQDAAQSQSDRRRIEDLLRSQESLQRELKTKLTAIENTVTQNSNEIQTLREEQNNRESMDRKNMPPSPTSTPNEMRPGPVEDQAPSKPLSATFD